MRILILSLLVLLAACVRQPPLPPLNEPAIEDKAFLTADGQRLPLHRWLPEGKPKAVIVALHGFNDYGRFIEPAARFFRRHGIAVYSYDQRGFGAAPRHGYWAGTSAYVDDLATFTRLLRKHHPHIPLYVLGESMGGAVAIVAASRGLVGDGLILAAPAVWARWTMPWYQRTALWLGDHLIPWVRLSGSGLGILASDNIEMLRALGRDPLVIKETRIDAIAGLVDLMDQAQAAAPRLQLPTLYLYGGNDQVVPKEPTLAFLRRVDARKVRLAWYDQAYHMLLRDLAARRYWRDILSWIQSPEQALPSGADRALPSSLALTDSKQ